MTFLDVIEKSFSTLSSPSQYNFLKSYYLEKSDCLLFLQQPNDLQQLSISEYLKTA